MEASSCCAGPSTTGPHSQCEIDRASVRRPGEQGWLRELIAISIPGVQVQHVKKRGTTFREAAVFGMPSCWLYPDISSARLKQISKLFDHVAGPNGLESAAIRFGPVFKKATTLKTPQKWCEDPIDF